ncbi:Beta-1,4-galactosyltransferase 7 [Halotydeus destructor]|nr:Beta-1,4-galactosyltransferase 7 [Halotydeus destructor]
MTYFNQLKLLLILISCCFFISMILVLSPLAPSPYSESCGTKCPTKSLAESVHNSNFGHKLAVIVPHRNRLQQLIQFVPHIHKFLQSQTIDHEIFIINQADNLRFNRASLINIGFLISKRECDYIAMHDVDLLPLNNDLKYSYPGDGTPFHVSSPDLHPKYHYKTFVGGILLLTVNDFELVNGMSNKYWGWGLEDDEFYARMTQSNLNITRPQGIKTGINDTFIHIHDTNSKRDMAKLFNQKDVTRRRDRDTGVNNVQFEIVADTRMTIEGAPCRLISVQLKCNYQVTPWCDHKFAATSANGLAKSQQRKNKKL